jgi:hypothetical protein
MKSTRKLILSCAALLAVGVLTAQSRAASLQTQPSQPPQTQRPAEPSQPPQSTPQGQPGQTPAQPVRPTIDDQVQMLTQDLGLNPEQQTKMRSILQEQHQQAMTIVEDGTLSREEKVQKIRALREATIDKTRAMLNDEQKKKLEEMLNPPQQAPPPSGQPAPGANPPPSTAPPARPTPPPASNPPSY